ncbi:nucleoside hydrolase [Virgisporangium ochraceum]|uniref:nucleoside hydrolase n=1 Tax=Virgisporangium ochraceum TaxID=65505 RepID=UPI001945073E|nr:nucleoside hydrolase [Virgisporangium ochraceum]
MTSSILIDCDPGIDDAVALMLAAASPGLSVRAVTATFGNVGLDATARNALAVCELVGLDVPVHAGADRPLVRDVIGGRTFHGDAGLGGVVLPPPARDLAPGHAVDAIRAAVHGSPGEVTLVVTGAMTNVALALRLDPGLVAGVRRLVFMGGSTEAGNVTPAAEFNALADPHAMRVVLDSGIPLTMFGLNVTHRVLATPDRIARIRALGNPVAEAAATMLGFYLESYRVRYGWTGAALHDPCTIAHLLDPTLFTVVPMHVTVDTNEGPNFGRTTCDARRLGGQPPNVDVAVDADADRFFDLLAGALARY